MNQVDDECDQSSPQTDDKNVDSSEKVMLATTTGDSVSYSTTVDTDPYAYLSRDPASSENFKIEIKNIPKYSGVQQVKKKLQNVGLTPHKVKILPHITFVTFKSEKDRDFALQRLGREDVFWKGKALISRIAKGRADPCAQKRKAEDAMGENQEESNAPQVECAPPTAAELSEKVVEAICPYYNKTYDVQLQLKRQTVETALSNMYRSVGKTHPKMKTWLRAGQQECDAENPLLCPLEGVLPSPITTEYRNKCEFTIGQSALNGELVVGFRAGKYRGGELHQIWLPDTVAFLQPQMLQAAHITQIFLRRLAAVGSQETLEEDAKLPPLPSFHLQTKEGYWRTLTVRCPLPREGVAQQLMLIFDIHPQSLTQLQLTTLKEELVKYYQEGEGKQLGVTSLLLCCRKNNSDTMNDATTQVLFGSRTVTDAIGSLQFNVAYNAFFQVNRPAATLLYETIGEMCQLNSEDTVLLDICCGTGTIGLCLAKRVFSVIGIELCSEAVENARENSRINNVSNASFLSGPVQDLLPHVLSNLNKDPRTASMRVVAIVDPPRPGLHSRVIVALRACERVSTIIYVSCDVSAVKDNFVELTRIESNRVKGAPFLPKKAVAVDLFPQTQHVECVILCERYVPPTEQDTGHVQQ